MSVSYQVTDIMRNTENCQGQCNDYIIEFIFRTNHRDVVLCGGSRHGAVIAIGLWPPLMSVEMLRFFIPVTVAKIELR